MLFLMQKIVFLNEGLLLDLERYREIVVNPCRAAILPAWFPFLGEALYNTHRFLVAVAAAWHSFNYLHIPNGAILFNNEFQVGLSGDACFAGHSRILYM